MNNIIIELCTEDRARLDRIEKLLEEIAPVKITQDLKSTAQASKKHPTEAPEAEAQELANPAPENPAPAENVAEEAIQEETEPMPTLEQIQQKVVQLAAGYNGTKKARVREIINAHAKKVSELPQECWREVWQTLTMLESED